MSVRDKNLPAHHVEKGDSQLNGPFLDDINAALDEQRRANINEVSEIPDFDSLEELEEFKKLAELSEADLVLLTKPAAKKTTTKGK